MALKTKALIFIGMAGLGLWLAQASAPKVHPSLWVTGGIQDREILATVAAYPDFDAYVRREQAGTIMTLPLARGADLLELGRVTTANRFRTLWHESPVVRAYAAFQLIKQAPERVKALRPLLADGTELVRAEFGEAATSATVATVVLDMLCAAANEPAALALLKDVRRDPRLLRIWPKTFECLAP